MGSGKRAEDRGNSTEYRVPSTEYQVPSTEYRPEDWRPTLEVNTGSAFSNDRVTHAANRRRLGIEARGRSLALRARDEVAVVVLGTRYPVLGTVS